MSAMSPEQIKAEIDRLKALLKAGITSADPDAIEIAGRIKFVSEKRNISVDKVIAAVKGALGGKTDSAGGTRKKSLRNVMKDAIREDDETVSFSNGTPTEAIEKDYIARFGQEKYDALKAEYPPSPSAKYKK